MQIRLPKRPYLPMTYYNSGHDEIHLVEKGIHFDYAVEDIIEEIISHEYLHAILSKLFENNSKDSPANALDRICFWNKDKIEFRR